MLAEELTLVGSRGRSAELAAKAISAEATNEQVFLAVAEYLLGPGREAAVDQLKLGSCHIRGVDVEAGP
jgi:hypothetical protein